MNIRVDRGNWEERTDSPAGVRDGMLKMRQALEHDEKEARERGSGLPKDWRTRNIR